MDIPKVKDCSMLKEIAKGGQKTVYSAIHSTWGAVVIKVGKTNSNSSKERIKREISLLSALSSSYYPKQLLFDFSSDISVVSDFTIIEEFIDGATLRDSMNKFQTEEQILSLLESLLEGLSLIWYDSNGKTVHRDLKPENIIIRPDLTPCILDLGIARLLQEESLTPSIYPYGPCTPSYASPEQLSNNKNSIDARSDFFSLGIIIAELILGHNPFDSNYIGTSSSIPENIMKGQYYDLANKVNMSSKFKGLITRLLMPKPYQRFRNVQSILKQINA